jgi:hypothetical protein
MASGALRRHQRRTVRVERAGIGGAASVVVRTVRVPIPSASTTGSSTRPAGSRLTLGRWFDRLIDCCEVLRSVGTTGDAGRLVRAESLLAEAGEYARGFNAEHAGLVGELRELVGAAAGRARLPVR